MENIEPQHNEEHITPKPIEHNYEAHKEDPGPSREAVEEKDENGASKAMKWIIPILVLALLIYWFIFWK